MTAIDTPALPAATRPTARRERFPRLPLYGAFAVILFAIAASAFGAATDIGTIRNVTTAPKEIRELSFVEKDSVLTVVDAHSKDVVAVFAPEEGGFVRGALRGLNRARTLRGLPHETPFRLILWDNGTLTLSDPATGGQRIALEAFGRDNLAAFARLLDTRNLKP